MAAGAYKDLSVALSPQLHPFMAHGASGVGGPGDRFPVSALPVLADQHLAVLSLYQQQVFSAPGTFFTCHVVMAEFPLSPADLFGQLLRIAADLRHERGPGKLSPGDPGELHFPVCRQLRLF